MNTNCTKDNGRLAFIDIAKGILIILVVMGHIAPGDTVLHHYIFWFHMPAFLLISGFFIKSTFVFKEEMEKKLKRLMIPYLFFSLSLLRYDGKKWCLSPAGLGDDMGGGMLIQRIAHFHTILSRYCFVRMVFIMY